VASDWPGTYDDVKAGILAPALNNSGEFDLSNSVLVGCSAGGHLANPSKQPSHVITTILQGNKDDIVPAFKLDQLQ
jgi:hypothetical protein